MGLSHPICNKVLTRAGDSKFKVGAASMQGLRSEMEDTHDIHMKMKKHPESGFFCVFDGHAGDRCSKWCQESIHEYVDNVDDWGELTKAFLCADDKFLTSGPNLSGTCAVMVIADTNVPDGKYKLTIANIGDSRALIGRNGETVSLTEDHKPSNSKERKRIGKAGGRTEGGRVNGQLAVSRAFGDGDYKENKELDPSEQMVIAVPDYTQDNLGPNDFLVLCCDGIFEAFTNEQTVNFVTNSLKETNDLAQICADLIDAALVKGSNDNMTVMIVLAADGTDYHQGKDQFLPGPLPDKPMKEGNRYVMAFIENLGAYTMEEAEMIRSKT